MKNNASFFLAGGKWAANVPRGRGTLVKKSDFTLKLLSFKLNKIRISDNFEKKAE